jgi:Tol biopolymer transport system component
MADPALGAPLPSGNGPEDRLESWKEIAAHFRRDVTTVQRWEKREGLPVRRHLHDKLGTVYAFRSELDEWARGRTPRTPPKDNSGRPPVDTPERGLGADFLTSYPPLTSPGPPAVARRFPASAHYVLLSAALAVAAAILWPFHDVPAQNSLGGRSFHDLASFPGVEQAAAISDEGGLVAFLSDRDGQIDVFVTQVGSGVFHHLTRGRATDLVNTDVRTLGFSPDGTLVTFWTRSTSATGRSDIGVWAIPVFGGGDPLPYLEGVAEFDWSSDGSRLVYHTPGPGDPMFVRDLRDGAPRDRPIFTTAEGRHSHFPIWSPDEAHIYFVSGEIPGGSASPRMDIWRITPDGQNRERITLHDSRVSHPVMPDARTLMYLATDAEGGGPWLYTLDVETRGTPRRLSSSVETYTSLAGSIDGRLVVTLARPKTSLFRGPIMDRPADVSALTPISLSTGSGLSARLGPDYLVYVSRTLAGDEIWRHTSTATTKLWAAPGARMIGGPDIEVGGRRIVFSMLQQDRSLLYVMNEDGAHPRVVTAALDLVGAPAWWPGGESIVSAAKRGETPGLFRVRVEDGAVDRVVEGYSMNPLPEPRGRFLLYSGPDVGTYFSVKAAAANGTAFDFPAVELTRGSRRLRFLGNQRALVVMQGDLRHKNLWSIDPHTGAKRQLTNLPADFELQDFDISGDGREMLLQRVQTHSDVLIALPE